MKESKLPLVGSLICIGAFIYLATFLVKNAIPLNLATWTLWTVLDISIAYNMFKANNPGKWVMSSFAAGAGLIALITIVQLVQDKTSWGWSYKETITLICFTIAIIVSYRTTDIKVAVNAGTTAMLIAGLPTLIDAWNQPAQQNAVFWGTCTVGCIVTLIGTPKGFTKRYFPVGALILNGSIAALAIAAALK